MARKECADLTIDESNRVLHTRSTSMRKNDNTKSCPDVMNIDRDVASFGCCVGWFYEQTFLVSFADS